MDLQTRASRRNRFCIICASTAVLAAALAAPVVAPAAAQAQYAVSFGYFHDQLSQYGDWIYSDRWGDVWRPGNVPQDFRPYYYGHWQYTDDYGWYWMSDEPFGDITYHYGRWVFDYDAGWLWVPGYVWGPAWVVWRSNDDKMGWFPMPPGDNYDGDGDYPDAFDSGYGYSQWYGPRFDRDRFFDLWTFVDLRHIDDHDFHRYEVLHRDFSTFMRHTHDETHYTTVNNFVVNRSIDPHRFEQVAHHAPMSAPTGGLFHGQGRPQPRTFGLQVQTNELQRHAPPKTFAPWNLRPAGQGSLPIVQPSGRGHGPDGMQGPGMQGHGVQGPSNPTGGGNSNPPGRDYRGPQGVQGSGVQGPSSPSNSNVPGGHVSQPWFNRSGSQSIHVPASQGQGTAPTGSTAMPPTGDRHGRINPSPILSGPSRIQGPSEMQGPSGSANGPQGGDVMMGRHHDQTTPPIGSHGGNATPPTTLSNPPPVQKPQPAGTPHGTTDDKHHDKPNQN